MGIHRVMIETFCDLGWSTLCCIHTKLMRIFNIFALILALVGCNQKLASMDAVSDPAQRPRAFTTNLSEEDSTLVSKLQNDMSTLTDIDQRADYASNSLVGRSSEWAPPLETTGFIEEKLSVNFSLLDCVRYVEQALALAKSRSVEMFTQVLRNIRYKYGIVSFSHRLHFPEADWIPENIRNGTLVDSTKEIADGFDPSSFKIATVTVQKEKWFESVYPAYLNEFRELFPKQSSVNTSITYIDFDSMWTRPIEKRSSEENEAFLHQENVLALQQANVNANLKKLTENTTDNTPEKTKAINALTEELKRLKNELSVLRKNYRLKDSKLDTKFIEAMPDFSVVALVRPTHQYLDKSGQLVTNMLISHLGFVVKRNSELFLRHAPSAAGSKVIEIPFKDYYENYLTTGSFQEAPENRRSTWRGLNVMTLKN